MAVTYGTNAPDHIVGSDEADEIYGWDRSNGPYDLGSTIDHDSLDGGNGNDHLDGGNGDDVINGGSGNDTLIGNWGNDKLIGGAGNDYINDIDGSATDINGGLGDDEITVDFQMTGNIDGGSGTDTLFTYWADSDISQLVINNVEIFKSGGGRIKATAEQLEKFTSLSMADYSNGSFIEIDLVGDGRVNLASQLNGTSAHIFGTSSHDRITTSSGDDEITGGDGRDTIFGGAGNDILDGGNQDDVIDGGSGEDRLFGGAGNDTYVIDTASDFVFEEVGDGVDTVRTSVSYDLTAWVENLVLIGEQSIDARGNELSNRLTGNAAANVLDGAAGADTLIGGSGDDVYIIDDRGDLSKEVAGGGVDTVEASLSWSLGAHLENLILTGNAALNGYGNALANQIVGNAGSNVLDGKAGADTLIGGAGDDTYVIDDTGDVAIELAGAGVDTVRALVSYTLTANVENLVLSGGEALKGYGNALANRLTGNAADNVLDGREGADIMRGGAGDDTYRVDDTGDVVAESANGGFDTVRSSVTYTLSGNVEKLVLTGDGDLSGTGNALANELFGNAGANRLAGKLGADRLTGGSGEDVFVFDTALGGGNVDTVIDFASAVDRIELSALVFRGLASGSLTADAFALGREATDLDDRILYDRTTGGLFFDRDGSANVYSAVQFATLTHRPAIEAADFEVA